ncbi:MAG: energy transducer TonB [Betaproteobacteria bacterium]|nr:energy transducer TonB [Betaproteobacteria bacterium]
MPILVVPVSVQMVAPQTELVTSPEPLSQKTPKPRQIEPPKLRSVAPDAPVVASVSWPMPPPEPPAAPPPAAAITAPDTFSAAPKIELPLSAADYLINPAPTYPPVSRRLMEQGKVLLHVRVDAQGLPTQIELKRGSGFSRLDDAALATVQRWRFVPGKRNGVPESMWVEVPIEFRLS